MRVLKQTDRYVILDDVLPPEQFELMVEYAARNDYARNPRWIKPWDLGDEMPWQTGETVYTRGKALNPPRGCVSATPPRAASRRASTSPGCRPDVARGSPRASQRSPRAGRA